MKDVITFTMKNGVGGHLWLMMLCEAKLHSTEKWKKFPFIHWQNCILKFSNSLNNRSNALNVISNCWNVKDPWWIMLSHFRQFCQLEIYYFKVNEFVKMCLVSDAILNGYLMTISFFHYICTFRCGHKSVVYFWTTTKKRLTILRKI